MLIDRLFAEADAAEKARRPATRASDRSDYRQYYGLLKDQPLPVSRATGRLLYMLARSVQARSIVEFGTSFGISTLHLAAALRDNGGGRLIGSEFEPTKITLARDLPDSIDLVLLDGAKSLYSPILSLLEGRLRSGALIVADNADESTEYLARVRSPSGDYLSVPFADDVELSMRLEAAAPRTVPNKPIDASSSARGADGPRE
jgi:predicted O-methyltransferase YrrM